LLTTIQFVPGAVTGGQPINLPSWAPKIDAVSSAYIIRPTSQISIANHPALSHAGTAVADHTTGSVTHLACSATDARYGTDTNLATVVTGATHTVTQPNDHPAQAHTVTGANPVVSATPTKVDEDTITLNVNTQLGDILVLTYIPVGARLRVA
jgi:hypothetical protein